MKPSGNTTLGTAQLSQEELRRYGRHLIMPEIGLEGQQKLKAASALIVGAGGLGSPAALYLAAAGVGTIGMVDFDAVDASNLQRQILHGTADVGRSKLISATKRIHDINPHVHVRSFEMQLTSVNALDIIKDFDIIIDGTDNFPTRYLINDACTLLKKPDVYGSIYRFNGQITVFDSLHGPCYRCLHPQPPPPELVPSCAEGGVLGVLPGIIGTIQAAETVKLILGIGDTLVGRVLQFDALKMKFEEFTLHKNTNCPVCGDNPTISHLIDYEEFCGVSRENSEETAISPEELKAKLDSSADILLLDVRQLHESEIVNIGGILIPLNELSNRIHELDRSQDIVAYCHTGSRSRQAVALLQRLGFQRVKFLAEGIDGWAARIDTTLPRY